MTGRIHVKRAYEAVSSDDGTRILVDRLWPRGVAREDLKLDLWLKQVAPSTELRKWFGHDPEKWPELKTRYRKELAAGEQAEAFARLHDLAAKGTVTLVYAARDEAHNHALLLKEWLEQAG
jgi:uncharacterized protein YeaO (DUF488 family)